MRKILILTVFIILCTFTTAFADEFSDLQGTKYEQAVEVLSAYDIINGFPDGTFRPNEPVTRAQMAKMATVVMGYGDFAQNMQSNYLDMDNHWATRYVDIANSFDIVQGYLDGTFGPDNPVTYSEAITMILRILGYTDASLPGSWPYDYFAKAGDLGLLQGIPVSADNATRGYISTMLYRALLQEYGTVDQESGQWKSSGKLLLSHLGYKLQTEVLQSHVEQALKYPQLSNYLFYKGDLFYNTEGEIVYFINTSSNAFSGTVTSITGKTIIIEDQYGNRKPFDTSGAKIIHNGRDGNLLSLQDAKVTLVYEPISTTENRVSGILSSRVSRHILVSKIYVGETVYHGLSLPLTNGKVDPSKIKMSGAASTLNDIKVDDLVYAYETDEPNTAKSYLEMVIVRSKVRGNMTETSTNNASGYSVINGKIYYHSDLYKPIASLVPGYYVEAILDALGNVVKYELIRDLTLPDQDGLYIGRLAADGLLPEKVRFLDASGTERIRELKDANANTSEMVSGLLIKYSLDSSGAVIRMVQPRMDAYNGRFNGVTGYLADAGAYLTGSTVIYYKDGTKWTTLTSNKLSEFIKAKIVKSYNGAYVDALILESGLKDTYAGTIYGVLTDITTVQDSEQNTVYRFKVYIDGKSKEIYSAAEAGESLKTISGYKGQLLSMGMDDGKVTSFSVPRAEIDFVPTGKIYDNNLIKVDTTFYEYMDDTVIYQAKETDTGYSIEAPVGIEAIKEGDLIRLYDLKGNFDGIIDTIIIIPQ